MRTVVNTFVFLMALLPAISSAQQSATSKPSIVSDAGNRKVDHRNSLPNTSPSAPPQGVNRGVEIFLVMMAIVALVWAFIIYRYHEKFPILKHPNLGWRGPSGHP